jgi:hypothetical protein
VIAELEEWIEKQEANKSHPQPPPAGDTLGVID